MKKLLLFLAISFLVIMNISAQKGGKHKVLFQFTTANDTLQQKSMTNQINNVLSIWPDAKIEVVCHNHGIEYLMKNKSKFTKEIQELSAKGVDFVACQNTMNRLKLTKEDLLYVSRIVPAGVVEIVEKQEKKWSYVRGGF